MPPAARVLDQTTHGPPLVGSGSPTVLIGGKPAWRAGADFHTCPMTTPPAAPPPPIPHIGGVVQKGSTSVLINGMPATRQGDTIIENGPPNVITSGEPTVIIG
jgi:uncharacterized Zn-binding protein involved in type VI secretion